MSYLDTLNAQQKSNIALIVKAAKDRGITNEHSLAGMLAIVSKESNFLPQEEISYANTNNSRIRKTFGSRVSSFSDSELNKLKSNKTDFFNLVYANSGGNKGGQDGSKYLGRGFNQLTGRGNYKAFGDAIGIDLINNPEKVNDPETAAKVLVAYNEKNIVLLKEKGKLKEYNADNINDFKNPQDSVLAFYHATAGAGKPTSYVKGLAASDHLGGMTKALARVSSLMGYGGSAAVDLVKKKPLITVLLTTILIVGSYILVKYSKNSK